MFSLSFYWWVCHSNLATLVDVGVLDAMDGEG